MLKSIRDKKRWTEAYDKVNILFDDLTVIMDFHNEGEASEAEVDSHFETAKKAVEDLEFLNMLSGEEDKLSAIQQINPGAGGTESQDWAQMLMRMYIRYAELHKFKVRELDFQEGDVAGIKSVSLEIDGNFAFGYLKGEDTHR